MNGLRSIRSAALVSAIAALGLWARPASAQIKEPGNHPMYDVEIEPHFLAAWDGEATNDEGIGLGLRASIPLMDNGPVTKINNNMAIGFGLDWAHFDDACGYWFRGNNIGWRGADCTENDFIAPVVVQWNFFFTKVVSAYGEFGLAMVYSTWDSDYACGPGGCGWDTDGSDFDLEPVFGVGGRFIFSDSFGLNVRISWPYFSVGPSFLL
jgi:hypothetical protein